jgi:hypothetical protein
MLAPDAAKLFVQALRILPRKLRHAMNSQKLEVAQHGGADGDQILETPGFLRHRKSP